MSQRMKNEDGVTEGVDNVTEDENEHEDEDRLPATR